MAQLMMEEPLLLIHPNSSQPKYSGRYLNGRMLNEIYSFNIYEKSQVLIFLLAKRNATEFDGEVAYEFKNDFIGLDFPKIEHQARRQILTNEVLVPLSHEEIVRVREWLQR